MLTADSLQKMGYTNVYSLKGGYHAWTIAGLPIQQKGEITYPDKIDVRDEMENSDGQTDTKTAKKDHSKNTE